jgi:hypothetical protein
MGQKGRSKIRQNKNRGIVRTSTVCGHRSHQQRRRQDRVPDDARRFGQNENRTEISDGSFVCVISCRWRQLVISNFLWLNAHSHVWSKKKLFYFCIFFIFLFQLQFFNHFLPISSCLLLLCLISIFDFKEFYSSVHLFQISHFNRLLP